MKKNILFLFILLSVLSYTQENCTYRGMVLDSLNMPVFDASITAFDENNKNAGYTFSDSEGEFELEMLCGKKYELEIEHLAYKPLVHKVDLDKSKREKIVLSNSSVQLKDIVAQGKVPIKMKGDTIEYDADFFKNGQEEDLEDILKKLPGIEVENGKVYHHGKEIRSIKVEGREVLGGNTKLLTKNLPSDAVDKIQLNKKFKANPFANSLQDEEQPELNITLKEDKKSLIFGNATIGGDAKKHYDLQEKLFRFSPKTDATLISDFNTYGKEVFDSEDYFRFLGGMSELMQEGGFNSLRNSMGNILFGSGTNATKMHNHLGALHLGYEPNKKLTISAFALATDNNLNYKSNTKRIYPTLTQTDENTNNQDIFSFISRFNLNYDINKRSNLVYRVNFNQVNSEDQSEITTFLNDDTTPTQFRNSYSDRKNINLSQRLSYIRKVGTDDNLGIYFTHSHQKETPNLSLNSTEQLFPSIFNFTEGSNGFLMNQKKNLTSNTFQGLAIYNHLITNVSNIRIKLGGNLSLQNLNNQIYDNQTLISDAYTPADMDFKFSELYADATYTHKIDKLKFDLGLGVHNYKTENKGNKTNTERNITKFLPHLNAQYDFNTSKHLNLSYSNTYEIPQVRELTEAYDIDSYYSIYRGNPELQETKYHQANLGYSYFDYFSFLNFYANISYSKKLDNIRTESYFDNLIQYSNPFNSNIPEDSWSGNIFGSKRFNKVYTLKINGTANYSTYGSISNDIQLDNTSKMYIASLSNNFKIRKKLEIDADISYIRNNYGNEITKNSFSNIKPSLTTAWVISDKILFQSKYIVNNQYSNGEKLNTNHDLSASLRIKPAKKIYFYLSAGNLLNSNRIVSDSFNDFYTIINTRETLGRYIIGTVKVKF